MMTTTLKTSPAAVPHDLDLCGLLGYRAWHQPEQLAYQFLERGEEVCAQLTYRELETKAQVIAFHLQRVGATSGQALLLFSPGLDFVAAFFGCLYAGVTAVPAYPPRKNNRMFRLQTIVGDAEASAVLTTTALAEKIGRWFDADSPLGTAHWLAVDTLEKESLQVGAQRNPLAFLQYTSGSTGTPKGVMVSQQNLIHNLAAIHSCFEHGPESKGVIWLPPYHDMGLIGGILQPLYGGFSVTLMAPVDFLQKPLRWLKAVSQQRATTSGGPDFAYNLCVQKLEKLRNASSLIPTEDPLKGLDLSSWKVAFTGAEPIRVDTLERFAAAFSPYGFSRAAFYPCYGMAETTLIVSGGRVGTLPTVNTVSAAQLGQHKVKEVQQESDDACRVVSSGRSLPDQQIVIVHPDTLRQCQPEDVGEIWVAGDSIAMGYWHEPQKTQESFEAYLADTGKGPFLRTGDLGFVQAGELFVTGRLKDMMIIRGKNYYPQDIERMLETVHPAIRAGAIAAFSIEHKGVERLVIVSEVERTHLRQLDVKAVSSQVRQEIAAAHDLQVFATLLVKPGSIPKTSSGKIQRYRCRELFLTGDLAVVKDWSEDPKHRRDFVKMQSDMDSMLKALGDKIEAK
ncbi:MAG: fatty acyl-AMP ligase [Cyanobacteria bacterium J06626_6]